LILDPHASDICCRYSTIAQHVQVMALEGLPEGIDTLRKLLELCDWAKAAQGPRSDFENKDRRCGRRG